ncbi:hypothetical protein F5972_08420 [Microbispora cellulosiformans]|uniref:Uncharacterized protein n=1 Tax=Microbispora cellulosiformans TaxID=2614688 RepID=A0A5J5K5V1_9ACTN|nr:hypothetical protein [Microbispora cellulosiformans]KAA9379667.1 hypothetical protein F5972_08420 [Microbispora cellulosiformans]
MATSFASLLPEVPVNRWHAEKLGEEGDDYGTHRSFYTVDAGSGVEAEQRVLAWIHHDYQDDLRHAEVTADPNPLQPGRWRVTVVWDTRRE